MIIVVTEKEIKRPLGTEVIVIVT